MDGDDGDDGDCDGDCDGGGDNDDFCTISVYRGHKIHECQMFFKHIIMEKKNRYVYVCV